MAFWSGITIRPKVGSCLGVIRYDSPHGGLVATPNSNPVSSQLSVTKQGKDAVLRSVETEDFPVAISTTLEFVD